jgi:signal transduction histidine kinase
MLRALQKRVEGQPFVFGEKIRQRAHSISLAVAVGIAYFLTARLTLLLLAKPDDSAVSWLAAGVATGVLIILVPGARWPVVAGVMIGSIPANLLGGRNLWASIVFAPCNAIEVVLVAALVERYFGSPFTLSNLRQVLGLIAAAIVGCAVAALGGTIGFALLQGSTEIALVLWFHWLTSNVAGIVAITPLLIGLAATARAPPPPTEFIEGFVLLMVLGSLGGLIIFLPGAPWVIVGLVAALFPLLLWLSARCSPVFAAAAAFILAITIVWTTTFRIGMFADFPNAERIVAGRAAIVAVSLCAVVLAALFAERRDSEARLARSNVMLELERDNKLLNAQAITAAIAHEVSQPLGAIELNGEAGLDFLSKIPPDLDQIRSILNDMITAGRRTSEVIGDIHILFGKADHRGRGLVDVNALILEILRSLGIEFERHRVETRTELTPELPFVDGNSGQLQEVINNLVRNAVEAMDTITNRARLLRVRTELRGRDAIAIVVEDTGPGIEPTKLSSIFDAFTRTKPDGMGLGLAICRMISESHGGQLTASSDGKSGSLFLLVLPIASIRGHPRKGLGAPPPLTLNFSEISGWRTSTVGGSDQFLSGADRPLRQHPQSLRD